MSGDNYIDDSVTFDGGPMLRRRNFPDLGVTVVEPFLGEISAGNRVLVDDEQGIGLAVDDGQSAVVSSVFGGTQVVPIPHGARRLPVAIEASIQLISGEWVGLDVTETILGLSIEDLHSIRDGGVPPVIAAACEGAGAVNVDVAAAVSFYFGRLPVARDGMLAPAPRISYADLEQARVIDRDLRREVSPDLVL